MKMQPKSKTKRLENQRKLHQQPLQHQQQTPTSTPILIPQSHQIQTSFPIGSEVEVTSDEEGFKGAWYLATVIQHPPSSSSSSTTTPDSLSSKQQDKIFVEYKNLLSDENGSTLLQELVDAKFVRPKYPILDHDKVCFELNDVVDAFYQDGWWCGVITHVVAKNKYRVFFPHPPDEIEFESFELRIHKKWVDGIWILPRKERMRDWNFDPGTAVEVNIDPDNSSDVWFPATLIKKVASNTFLVEYQSSKETGLQKVAVDSLHIRPPPPSSNNKAFNLLEKVDAFYDFRWLSGVVTKILADRRYIVYFKRTKKEKELSHSDLRLHMEWHNGRWIQSSQDTSRTPSAVKHNSGTKEKTRASSDGPNAVKNGNALARLILRGSQKKLSVPVNEKANYSSATPSSKKIKQTSANGSASHSRSSRRSNDEPASDVPLSPETCVSKVKQVEGSNYGTSVNLDSLTAGHQQSDLKQMEDSSQPSDPTENKEENEKHSASKKRGRPPKSQALLSGDTNGETVDQTPNKSDVVKSFGPIVIGLTHDGKMIGSLAENSSQNKKLEHKNALEDEAKFVDSSADHESVVSNGSEQQKEGEVTNLKRKRGRPPSRPPKVLFRVGSPKTNEAGHGSPNANNAESVEEKKQDASVAKDDELHSPTNELEKPVAIAEPSDSSPTDHGVGHLSFVHDQMKPLSDFCRSSVRSVSRRHIRKQKKVPTKSVMIDINEPTMSVILRKGKKQKSTKQVVPQTEDDVDTSRMRAIKVFNNGVARDADRAIAGTSSNASDDDRPLSTWFEGAHSPITDAKGGPVGQSGENEQEIKTAPVGQHEEKEQDKRQYTSAENVSQDQAKEVPGGPDKMPIQSQSTAIVPMDSQDLPFVKNSLVWKMIESMEVLKRIPQKPHFRPLYNCKEECREGLAIGSMVTFTSLVERISKSQFDDPKSLLDGYLEALVDLEELGFNVEPVREQLYKMISIKSKYEQAHDTCKEIESQIMERNFEKSDIIEEISDIDKKIGELMEKRALVMSKKERKDAEIVLLQSSIDAVQGTLDNAEQEFEKVATSL